MSQHAWRARLPKLIVGGVLLVVMAGMYYIIKGFIDSAEKPSKSKVQIISLVKPPEPKPPEEKPPEPVKQEVKEEVPVDQPSPQPVADEPPPGLTSSLGPGDGAGFGLAAGDGKGTGRIGGGGGSLYARYAAVAQQALQDRLTRDDKVKKGTYKVVVKLWISATGTLQRYELAGSSGNADVDTEIKQALASVRALGEAPPPDMPQPIRLRIVSRS